MIELLLILDNIIDINISNNPLDEYIFKYNWAADDDY